MTDNIISSVTLHSFEFDVFTHILDTLVHTFDNKDFIGDQVTRCHCFRQLAKLITDRPDVLDLYLIL